MTRSTRFTNFFFFFPATRLRCNPEKITEENREYYEDLVLKPFTSYCIHRIDMPPNIHDLQDTKRIESTQRYDEHHVTVNACFCGFAGVPVVDSARITNFCTAPHSKIQLSFVKHFRIFIVSFSKFHSFFAILSISHQF